MMDGNLTPDSPNTRTKRLLDGTASQPVKPGSFPGLLDAARQQTELVIWVARTLEDHADRLQAVEKRLGSGTGWCSRRASVDVTEGRPRWSRGSPGTGDLDSRRPGSDARRTPGFPASGVDELGDTSRATSRVTKSPFPEALSPDNVESEDGRNSKLDSADPVSAHLAATGGDLVGLGRRTSGNENVDALSADVDRRLEELERDLQADFEQRLEEFARFVEEEVKKSQKPASRGGSKPSLRDGLVQNFKEMARKQSMRSDKSACEKDGDVDDTEGFSGGEDTCDVGHGLGKGTINVNVLGPMVVDTAIKAAEACLDDRMKNVTPDQSTSRPRGLQAKTPSNRSSHGGPLGQRSGSIRHATGSPMPFMQAIEALGEDASSEEVADMLRIIAKDMNARLPGMEEAIKELKPLRLQIPSMQSDLEELSMSMSGQMEEMLQMMQQMREKVASVAVAPKSEDPSDVESCVLEDGVEERGSPVGAHGSRVGTPRNSRVTSPVGNAGRSLAAVLRGRRHSGLGVLGVESAETHVKQTLAKLDAEQIAKLDKIDDVVKVVGLLEEKVKDLDVDYRSSAKRVDSRLEKLTAAQDAWQNEDVKLGRAWNLANQVDVIQSVVAQEMRGVRNEVEVLMRSTLDSVKKAAPNVALPNQSLNTTMPLSEHQRHEYENAHDIERQKEKELEDKIKRLQDCYQQCTLKLAGLKSASKHTEQQASLANEKIKKLAEEVEQAIEQAQRAETKLDYALLSTSAGGPRATRVNLPEQAIRTQASSDRVGMDNVDGVGSPASPSRVLRASAAPPSQTLTAPGAASPRLSSKLDAPGKPSVRSRRTSFAAPAGVNAVQAAGAPATPSETRLAPEKASAEQPGVAMDDLTMNRIWRLGKKVSDLDGEVNSQFSSCREAMDSLGQKLSMLISFLPRRQRRMLERLASKEDKKEEAAEEDKDNHKDKDKDDDKKSKSKKERKEEHKNVSFSSSPVETRTFNVEDDRQVPWQFVGEPDAKWSWCYAPRTEMGRDMALYFEQLEHERQEFEEEVANSMDRLREELKSLPAGGQLLAATQSSGKDRSFFRSTTSSDSGAAARRDLEKVEKALLPQLASLDERLERLTTDMGKVKANQEVIMTRKVDKEELQLVVMRLHSIEKIDPKQLELRLEAVENREKHSMELIEHLGEHIRKVEGLSAQRADVTKVRTEMSKLTADITKTQAELKDTNTSIFHSGRQLSQMLSDARMSLEKHLARLEQDKAGALELANLVEKVHKLDASMRDNRQILSDAGEKEIGSVVKRIILNMEDKIMVLEKKIDALAQGLRYEDVQKDSVGPPIEVSPEARSNAQRATAAQEATMQSLGSELSGMVQTVGALKQDISVTKVELDYLKEQGQRQHELAQRLHIAVETPGDPVSAEGQETKLSMNRVQVMIAAAARQLVAGSKWVTKETFDLRMGEQRRELLNSSRHLQAQMEELNSLLAKAANVAMPNTAPSMRVLLPKMASGQKPRLSEAHGDSGWSALDVGMPVARPSPRGPGGNRASRGSPI